MRDRATGKPRGFGFVTFSEPGAADAACAAQHTLDGRQIDAKPSVPPGEHSRPRSKKIFVGGLSPETTEGAYFLFFLFFSCAFADPQKPTTKTLTTPPPPYHTPDNKQQQTNRASPRAL